MSQCKHLNGHKIISSVALCTICFFFFFWLWGEMWPGHVDMFLAGVIHPSMALLLVMGDDMWQPRPHTEVLGPPRDSPTRLLKLSANTEYIQYFKRNPYGQLVPGSLVCVLMPSSLTTVSHPRTLLQDPPLFILLANPILTPSVTPALVKQKTLCQVISC